MYLIAGNMLTDVGNNIYNGFVYLCDSILTFFTDVFNEIFVGIFAIVTDFLLWLWNSIFWNLITQLMEKMQNLPFNDLINNWDITSTINGHLVTNFVDVNLVAASAVTSLGFLLSLGVVKGLVKLIPTVG